MTMLSEKTGKANGTKSRRDITRFAHVPEELIERPQWVLWRYEVREHGKTKVPYQCSGWRASSKNPRTWTTYAAVLEAYRDNEPPSDGIGYIFSADDPFVGIDLDHCLNPDGSFKAWAAPIYQKLSAGYVEISPSGSGLKIWMRGSLPEGKGRRRSGLGDDQKGAVEMYCRRRLFAVTGRRFQGGAA